MSIYVWTDLETTGLNKANSKIIEVAVIITTEDFKILDTYTAVINPGDDLVYEQVAEEFHKKSGLFNEVENGILIKKAEEDILALIHRYEPIANRANLAGNSIHFDRHFLEKYMPSITSHLTHRHLDVSSIGLAIKACYRSEGTEYNSPRPHRALPDLERSIKELQFYMENFFK